MKRLAALILAAVCFFCFASCNLSPDYKGALSCISHIGCNGTVTSMDMTETAQQKILTALNDGKWIDDVTNCNHDYEFTADSNKIRYHSECGTFIDITNGRAMTLSEEDRIEINNIFGAES